MKKSLIHFVKFMQNPNDMNRNVHAQLPQCDYVRSTGGGAKI
ncbi:MAG: hypothetical protein ACLSWI_05220 [Candidatus Gastranaerophilaceae bacterium]